MAVSSDLKHLFQEKVKPYKACVDDVKKDISAIKSLSKKNSKLEPYVKVSIAAESIKLSNSLVLISELSRKIQERMDDAALKDARKELSNAISDLLKITGSDMDGSLTENKDRLAALELMNPAHKLKLVRAFKAALDNVQNGMGSTSKLRWSFPDIHYKLAVLTKNLFDFKEFEKSKDPSGEFYRDRHELLKFLIEESQYSAQEYRSRYELSTRDVSDLETIRRIFDMLKKIYMLTGNKSELEKINTSLDAIKEKIDAHMKDKKKKG
ncbi:MAG: hypothetical protein HY042_10250 [Spirochaetia bacterium]|nr:hypothetical protein [Spirochaetia bacterium]